MQTHYQCPSNNVFLRHNHEIEVSWNSMLVLQFLVIFLSIYMIFVEISLTAPSSCYMIHITCMYEDDKYENFCIFPWTVGSIFRLFQTTHPGERISLQLLNTFGPCQFSENWRFRNVFSFISKSIKFEPIERLTVATWVKSSGLTFQGIEQIDDPKKAL